MKFKVSGKEFADRTGALARIISGKPAISILENFLCTVKGDSLTIMASDAENVLTTSLAISESEGDGEFLVNAKKIVEIAKEIGNQPLVVSVNDNTFEIHIDYSNGYFDFMGIEATEFPRKGAAAADMAEFALPVEVALAGLDSTAYAMSTDTLRPIMTGVHWDIEDERMTFVSSDTQILAKYENTNVHPGHTGKFTLPGKVANVLRGILPAFTGAEEPVQLRVAYGDKSARFEFGPYVFDSMLLKGTFPAYRRVFPESSPFKLVVNREALLAATRRVSMFSSTATWLEKYHITGNNILITAQDFDYSTKGEETVPCDYEGNDLQIGFNWKNMVKVLSALKGEDVVIELTAPARPGLFIPAERTEGVDIIMLQMPLQVIE